MNSERLTELIWKRLKDNGPWLLAREAVVTEFCGVNTLTFTKWFSGNNRPMGGLTTFKLWHLLASAGLASPELDDIRRGHPFSEYLGRLLAFGVITIKEAEDIGGAQTGAVFAAIRDESTLSAPNLDLESLQELYGKELAGKEKKLKDDLGDPIAPAMDVETSLSAPQLPTSTQPDLDQLAGKLLPMLLEQLKQNLQASATDAMPVKNELETSDGSLKMTAGTPQELTLLDISRVLADALVVARYAIEELSAGDRSKIRESVGRTNLFALSNLINGLCSEQAKQATSNRRA